MDLVARRLRARRSQRGVSTLELALYMPLLMMAILITVQAAMIFLGNQAASGAAREAARLARTGDTSADAEAQATEMLDNIAVGVLDEDRDVDVTITENWVHVIVTGRASSVFGDFFRPTVSNEVEGPIEQFVPDN